MTGRPLPGRPLPGRPLPGTSDPDDGVADPQLLAALQAWQRDHDAAAASWVEHVLLAARVYVPVVAGALGTRETASGLRAESEAEMSLVTLVAPSGATALVAFTSPAAMAAWRREVRPVAVVGALACRTAQDEGHAGVVLDVAGPAFTVQGEALAQLAAGGPASAPAVVAPALVAPVLVAPAADDVSRLVTVVSAVPLAGGDAPAGPGRVREVWLVGLTGRGRDAGPGAAVGVLLDEVGPSGGAPEALAAVGQRLAAALPVGSAPVDLLLLSGPLLATARSVGVRLA